MSRPLIADQRTGVVVGLVLLGGAFLVLHDAYDRRGRGAPWPLSALLPW
jgi:hypothetical protein